MTYSTIDYAIFLGLLGGIGTWEIMNITHGMLTSDTWRIEFVVHLKRNMT